MCLLECVEEWDEQGIQCRATSHRALDNPLRANGRLGTACGIEYAAQAMAVHGALLAPPDSTAARVGYLVSVRGTRMHVARLDDIAADLHYQARQMIERHPLGGEEVLLPGMVPKLSATPGETRWIGPKLGEHTDEVLGAAGYAGAEIAALRARGVIA